MYLEKKLNGEIELVFLVMYKGRFYLEVQICGKGNYLKDKFENYGIKLVFMVFFRVGISLNLSQIFFQKQVRFKIKDQFIKFRLGKEVIFNFKVSLLKFLGIFFVSILGICFGFKYLGIIVS